MGHVWHVGTYVLTFPEGFIWPGLRTSWYPIACAAWLPVGLLGALASRDSYQRTVRPNNLAAAANLARANRAAPPPKSTKSAASAGQRSFVGLWVKDGLMLAFRCLSGTG